MGKNGQQVCLCSWRRDCREYLELKKPIFIEHHLDSSERGLDHSFYNYCIVQCHVIICSSLSIYRQSMTVTPPNVVAYVFPIPHPLLSCLGGGCKRNSLSYSYQPTIGQGGKEGKRVINLQLTESIIPDQPVAVTANLPRYLSKDLPN